MQNGDQLERLSILSPAKRALLLKKFAQQNRDSVRSLTIKPRSQQGPALLSFAQQQLFYLYLLDPTNPAYNLPIALRLVGTLDVSALIASLQTLIQRHEILRTTITLIDGQPVQTIVPSLVLKPQMVDLSTCSKTDRTQMIDRIIAAELSTPFDLTRGPLIRVTLLNLGDKEHIFCLTMHHSISDGWSIGVLFQELETLYSAHRQGRSNPLPDLPIQYADYALWQREWLQGPVLAQHLDYWRSRLHGAPTQLPLPLDHPRPPLQAYQGLSFSFPIPQPLTSALLLLSQHEGVTLFTSCLTAFQILLARCTGQLDFLLGTPVANRSRQETQGLIGCLINTLVLRCDLTDHPSLRTLLQRTQTSCLQAYAHEELPFELLVEALQPERSAASHPLFQVLFLFQQAAQTSLTLPDLVVHPLELQTVSAKFDLTLSLTHQPEGLLANLEYNAALFEPRSIQQLALRFLRLLSELLAHPDLPVVDLPWLTHAEEHWLIQDLHPPFVPTLPRRCLHTLVQEQAARTPEALAVCWGEETLSYRQLEQRANALARRLRALGVGPEVLVGLCLPRSLELLIALLAILKAGGAYVPLDPGYPAQRLSYLLADSQAAVLLTRRGVGEELAAQSSGRVLWWEEYEAAALEEEEEEENRRPEEVGPGNLSYVIYTSGSTGEPKGVAISHGSAVHLVEWAQQRYSAQELRRVVASTSICFDLSLFELFVPWSRGGCCVLVEQALALASQPEQEVTLLNTVPSAARELVRLGGIGKTVETINLAGEALPRELVQELAARTGVRRIYNLYGPSEDTTYSTWMLVEAQEEGAPPIGQPLPGTQVYLLDQQEQLVAPGQVGEVYLGGCGLARGYLRRPGLTAERFVPDPFSGQQGGRLYRTADLARYREDGQLEFVGRRDQQVKVRGYRIELGEIETVLARHPAVRENVIVVQKDEAGVSYLAAFVSLRPDRDQGSYDLRGFLQKQLPGYMVPLLFFPLDAFPLTPNGKIDKQALSTFSRRAPASSHNLRGPRDLIELHLVQLWEKVLQKAPVGIGDNFFDLGGHSLLAIQLVTQIQKQFICNISLSTLIQQGTIEHIAHLIRSRGEPVHQSPLVLLHANSDATPFFCVHPAGGSVLCYVDLARHLDRPFYGLQAENLSEGEIQAKSLAEMAACYVAAIRSVQPEGPYLLGGWSLGGVIAFEMAQRLRTHGHEVAGLILIDSVSPALTMQVSELSQLDMLLGFAQHLGLPQERLAGTRVLISQSSGSEQWASFVSRLQELAVIPIGIDSLQMQQRFLVYQATIRAWSQYQPGQYPESLTLLRASEPAGRDEGNRAMGWQRVVGKQLTVIDIPGDHYTLIRQPHVLALAQEVQRCLDAMSRSDKPSLASI